MNVCKTNRQLSFLLQRDNKMANLKAKASEAQLITAKEELPYTKIKSQIMLLRKKNGLNVNPYDFISI